MKSLTCRSMTSCRITPAILLLTIFAFVNPVLDLLSVSRVGRFAIRGSSGSKCFSVNGEKQDGGFDDIEGEVFPCAGSYRSGVTIRLLKVGVVLVVFNCFYGTFGVLRCIIENRWLTTIDRELGSERRFLHVCKGFIASRGQVKCVKTWGWFYP